jgi:hypothetical protein
MHCFQRPWMVHSVLSYEVMFANRVAQDGIDVGYREIWKPPKSQPINSLSRRFTQT